MMQRVQRTIADNINQLTHFEGELKPNNVDDSNANQQQIDASNIEKSCFHLYEKICPNCDGPLKRVQECRCLRCEKDLYYIYSKTEQSNGDKEATAPEKEEDGTSPDKAKEKEGETKLSVDSASLLSQNFFICMNCERFYTFCLKCFTSTSVCQSCRSDLNVCSHCRRKLCAFCLQEVATGQDIEKQHINELQDENQQVNRTKSLPLPPLPLHHLPTLFSA